MRRFSLEDEYSGAIPGSMADQLETSRRANAQYKAVQAQVADDQTKSACAGLFAVSACCAVIAKWLDSSATDSIPEDAKAKVHMEFNSNFRLGREKVEHMTPEQLKDLKRQADQAIENLKHDVAPWKMRFKGGVKYMGMVLGGVTLLLAMYHLYLRKYEKAMAKKAQQPSVLNRG